MILHGDCIALLPTLQQQFDACITDPPYHLTNRTPDVKWCVDCQRVLGGSDGNPSRCPRCGGDLQYQRSQGGRGFMGKQWDGGDIAFQPDTWRAVWRVLKPGAHLVAFGGTRTEHRMTCAIEDAGFEIRDKLLWLYGSGFPKSHNIGNGWGTALKPAFEPIILARKPLVGTVAANVLAHGTGAINIDACRVQFASDAEAAERLEWSRKYGGSGYADNNAVLGAGLGQCGSLSPAGRWPANVLHDGSDEVEAAFAAFGTLTSGVKRGGQYGRQTGVHDGGQRLDGTACYADAGTASRFFYCAKASKADRAGSKHPTVKPVALIRWLVRLITPPDGHILDPFAGSGTLASAAHAEQRRYTLIEQDEQYITDIQARVETLDMFNNHDLLQSFDVFKSTRPDLTTYTDQWCAYVRYSHDLAHPKFPTRHTQRRRQRIPKPEQLDLFATA